VDISKYKKLYFERGLILIDFFIIMALIQYFVFEGSLNRMVDWIKNLF
tara:strand:+ start:68 stop:211 length:144 start_codon:yes stop_codon:yes gene_type:complete